MPKKVVTILKTQLICLKDIYMTFRWHRHLENSLLEEGWEKYLGGNACSFIAKVDSSDRCTWMLVRWPERNTSGTDVNKSKETIRSGRSHSMQRDAEANKRNANEKHELITNITSSNIDMQLDYTDHKHEVVSWSYDMQNHAQK